MKNKITQDMLPSFQGVIPPTLATVSLDGMPNVTYISHVHYIDEEHLALSRQFFNKSWKNISENPHFTVAVTCPETFTLWKINVSYQEEEKEGDLFEEMDMIITAIASMQGMEDTFKLQSAVICKVESIQTLVLNGKIN
tara:strand:+ start:1319 stop:1735 length:417 start_codon:yes stop_codon:yes gene_type:complete